ncbi:MAG TPA: SPOR domain-containing protein [Candidatus Bathyarchaeia archaeon]|nr:SPOR domain-containing protein [Candidatus Bathyarchaeia archaeon]
MKNQWPFWLFVIAIVIVVLVSMNYQGKDDVVSIGEIFPGNQQELDYEYVMESEGDLVKTEETVSAALPKATVPVQSSVVVAPVKTQTTAVPPVQTMAPAAPKRESVVAASTASVATTSAAPATGSYTIQVLSSKDKSATEIALKKVQGNGFADAYIRSADLGERGTWYRIYIGQFSTKAQADQQLSSVKQKYASAFVTKVSN